MDSIAIAKGSTPPAQTRGAKPKIIDIRPVTPIAADHAAKAIASEPTNKKADLRR